MNKDKKYLRLALKQAKLSFDKGGFPAGSILVKDGKVISKGLSLGFKLNDPTEHSDISAIKKACKKLKTTNLEGYVLYSSVEPCLMCFSAANWANISKIVYACKKNEHMTKIGCYQGSTELETINNQNNHKIELIYIDYLEKESLKLIDDWEKSITKNQS